MLVSLEASMYRFFELKNGVAAISIMKKSPSFVYPRRTLSKVQESHMVSPIPIEWLSTSRGSQPLVTAPFVYLPLIADSHDVLEHYILRWGRISSVVPAAVRLPC